MIDFSRYRFHPVIALPAQYEVFDFTRGYDAARTLQTPYGVGKYDEDRRGMYDAELFRSGEASRTIHMGIDIAAPVGTPVTAFHEGEIFLFGYNPAPGDYGHTLVTRHVLHGHSLFALFGHLSARSTEGLRRGKRFQAGETIAWIGDRQENGGWNPHLHFQLSYREPVTHDMPGVVSAEQRAEALATYPDPRLVLGPLY